MSDQNDELTQWIPGLKDQDPEALTAVWEAYHAKLVSMVRLRLAHVRSREADEEDIAVSAFESFYRAIQEQRVPKLDDRNDLWRVLIVIANRKVSRLRKRHSALKRGGGSVRGESVFQGAADEAVVGLDGFKNNDPSPEMIASTAEAYEGLMNLLGDEKLRRIATWKLQGFTHAEIAAELNCAERTVERKLERIRSIWEQPEPTGDT